MFDRLSERHLRIGDPFAFDRDEVDVVFSSGFKDQFCDIFCTWTPHVQAWFLTVTMAPETWERTTKFMWYTVRLLERRKS